MIWHNLTTLRRGLFHDELVFRYPGVMHNLPIQEIASYLGISRRQLHRIREAESAADASDREDI